MYTDQESMDVNSTTSIRFNNVMQGDIFCPLQYSIDSCHEAHKPTLFRGWSI